MKGVIWITKMLCLNRDLNPEHQHGWCNVVANWAILADTIIVSYLHPPRGTPRIERLQFILTN